MQAVRITDAEGASLLLEADVDAATTTVGALVAMLPAGAAPGGLALAASPGVALDASALLSSLSRANDQDSGQDTAQQTDSTLLLHAMRAQKGRCVVGGCGERVARVVGDCRYCGAGFCGRHRLPEAHACAGLGSCREESHARNSSRLLGGKCVADKV